MDDDDPSRRRTIVIVLLAIVTVPLLFVALRSDDGLPESQDSADVVVDEDGQPLEASDSGPSRPPLVVTDLEPSFLDGPVADDDPGVTEIAVPARPENPPIRLDASYRSNISGSRTCLVRDVESGLSVTVTNLDNGRSISCVTRLAPDEQVAGLVMQTDDFMLLADLTEAPIAIELAR